MAGIQGHNDLISFLRSKGVFGENAANTAKWRRAGRVGMSAADAAGLFGGEDENKPKASTAPAEPSPAVGAIGAVTGSGASSGTSASGGSVEPGGAPINMGMGGGMSLASIQKVLGRRSFPSLARQLGPQPY